MRRIDHQNLLASDVDAIADFMPRALGSRITERIMLDTGHLGGCWFTVNNKSYDIAYTGDHTGSHGRFHHVTYALDQREYILQAADIFLENGVYIETCPHKHAVQQTFFLYVYEPAGNRVEVANAGARLILAPDWESRHLDGRGAQEGAGLGPEDNRVLPHPTARRRSEAARAGAPAAPAPCLVTLLALSSVIPGLTGDDGGKISPIRPHRGRKAPPIPLNPCRREPPRPLHPAPSLTARFHARPAHA